MFFFLLPCNLYHSLHEICSKKPVDWQTFVPKLLILDHLKLERTRDYSRARNQTHYYLWACQNNFDETWISLIVIANDYYWIFSLFSTGSVIWIFALQYQAWRKNCWFSWCARGGFWTRRSTTKRKQVSNEGRNKRKKSIEDITTSSLSTPPAHSHLRCSVSRWCKLWHQHVTCAGLKIQPLEPLNNSIVGIKNKSYIKKQPVCMFALLS